MSALQTLFGVLLQTCEVGAGVEQKGICGGQLRPAPADLQIDCPSSYRVCVQVDQALLLIRFPALREAVRAGSFADAVRAEQQQQLCQLHLAAKQSV